MTVPTRPAKEEGAALASTHPLGAPPIPRGSEVPAARPLFHPPSPKPKTGRKLMRQHELVERVKAYDPDANEALLDRAYVYAMNAHGKQFRASGDPYFTHPLEVAGILTELKLDVPTIVTALLHDTVEDTYVTIESVKENFGEEIAGRRHEAGAVAASVATGAGRDWHRPTVAEAECALRFRGGGPPICGP